MLNWTKPIGIVYYSSSNNSKAFLENSIISSSKCFTLNCSYTHSMLKIMSERPAMLPHAKMSTQMFINSQIILIWTLGFKEWKYIRLIPESINLVHLIIFHDLIFGKHYRDDTFEKDWKFFEYHPNVKVHIIWF